jgi:hypothetical protein
VLGTLRPAGFADVGANLADVAGKFAAARHIARGKPTNRRAIDVQPNAFRHHFDVLLAKTSGSAVVASIGALVAGVDTGLILLVSHHSLPEE